MVRTLAPVLVVVSALALSAPAPAQLLRGPEFVADAVRAGRQAEPDVAMAADGRFTVVWVTGGVAGGPSNLRMRLFAADGTPRTGDLAVSAADANFQFHPRVAMAADGRFIVVWSSRAGATAPSRVYGQLFRADGRANGQRFRLGSSTHEQFEPDVAMAPDGRFVAAWTQDDGGADPETGDPTVDVVAHRFAANGKAAGKEWTAGGGPLYQYAPAVAVNTAGAFAVAFEQLTADTLGAWSNSIGARTYGADGKLRAALTLPALPPATAANQARSEPAVALAADGSCLLAWTDSQADGTDDGFFRNGVGVLAQRYNALGQRTGDAVHVNTSTLDVQSDPALALTPDGGFLAAWTSAGWQDGDGLGVFAQRFAANGTKIGPETPLATWTAGSQTQPAVATHLANVSGAAIIVWQSAGNDGSDLGIAGRRIGVKP